VVGAAPRAALASGGRDERPCSYAAHTRVFQPIPRLDVSIGESEHPLVSESAEEASYDTTRGPPQGGFPSFTEETPPEAHRQKLVAQSDRSDPERVLIR
jgi:hypothetical protein